MFKFLYITSIFLFFVQCSTIDVGISQFHKEIKSMKKIAVVPFEMDKVNYGKEFSEEFALQLLKNVKIELIERDQKDLNKIMEEFKIRTSGIIDESSAAQMGKILGVDAIVIGKGTPLKLDKKNTDKTIDTALIKIIKVETGSILVTARKSSGIEWDTSSILKYGLGFGYIWTKEDILLDNSNIYKITRRIVDKIDTNLDNILGKPEEPSK